MTCNYRPKAALPLQGHQNPEQQNLGLFTPPNNKYDKSLAEGIRYGPHYGEICHGFARAIKSLRGMRMSLVPLPVPRLGVLPGV